MIKRYGEAPFAGTFTRASNLIEHVFVGAGDALGTLVDAQNAGNILQIVAVAPGVIEILPANGAQISQGATTYVLSERCAECADPSGAAGPHVCALRQVCAPDDGACNRGVQNGVRVAAGQTVGSIVLAAGNNEPIDIFATADGALVWGVDSGAAVSANDIVATIARP